MTIYSAREQLATMDSPSDYCFPLALDAVMSRTELPRSWYDAFKEARTSGNRNYSQMVSSLIREFFMVEPWPETDTASVAQYTAFSASEQSYMSDVSYDYPEQIQASSRPEVTGKSLRLYELITQATKARCPILFHVSPGHVAGLAVVDPGGANGLGGQSSARYAIRDFQGWAPDILLDAGQLSGFYVPEGDARGYAPLPEVSRPWFPANQTSWELTILPPEPVQ